MKQRTVNGRYWLQHPKFGTVAATLAIQSSNLQSLGFILDGTLALRNESGGLLFAGALPLMHNGVAYVDLMTGTAWEILDEEPVQ